MPGYDFHQLSPIDFEALTRDLLQARWQVSLESFKAGRDGGIDLRYASGPTKIVVQAKHYLRTGLRGLLRALKAEAEKVRNLAPSRYVLVTSVPLSPANKESIVQIIGPDFLQTSDIIGADDLNNLLIQHPEIEGRHYKLWLASRAILDRVISNAVLTRSEFKARQVHEQAKRYVASDAYHQALKMLGDERVVIIAGAPGVGKTTLADLLLYSHLAQGYQAVLIQRDVAEGEALFQPGRRQIFYFDDFMGATFAGEHADGSQGANGRALVNFISIVRSTPDARLVLTTREHVYSQALGRSERLRNAGLDDMRVVLSMSNYTPMQRAHILYNHLHFSDLPEEYRDELLKGDFYLRIVKHKKFNPRLIEWLSSYRRLKHVSIDRYRQFIINLLDDPSEIWRHAYEQEITEPGRSVLLAVHSLGGKCGGPTFERAFAALHAHRATRYNFLTRPEDFRTGVREVTNSFIKPWGVAGFEVIDPSVLDLLNAVSRDAPENAVDMIAGASSFEQVSRVWTFAKATKGGAIIAALQREAPRIAPTIGRLALTVRRKASTDNSVVYFGPTYERRLAVIVEMTARLRAPQVAGLIIPVFERLQEEWRTESPHISDSVELVRAIDALPTSMVKRCNFMRGVILNAILEEARTGCSADELRELLGVVNTEQASDEIAIVREGFAAYAARFFSDDLRRCRSREEFAGLIEDLELFRDQLGVDVRALIDEVQQANAEFEELEDLYADHMQDEWKELYRDERDRDQSITEMFGSLRGDRQ